jgi:hypothetical protein
VWLELGLSTNWTRFSLTPSWFTATEICLFLSRHVAAAGSMDPGVDLIVHISVGLTIGERKLRCL